MKQLISISFAFEIPGDEYERGRKWRRYWGIDAKD